MFYRPTVTYLSRSRVNLTIIYNILEVADKSGSPIMWVSNAGAGIGTAGAPIVCNTSRFGRRGLPRSDRQCRRGGADVNRWVAARNP